MTNNCVPLCKGIITLSLTREYKISLSPFQTYVRAGSGKGNIRHLPKF